MRIIPVIDLRQGRVVRAIAGRRSDYQPLRSPLCPESHPGQLAREFVQRFGARDIYVADLDAIEGREPDHATYDALAECGARLWIDPGIRTAEAAARFAESRSYRGEDSILVIALETLPDDQVLAACLRASGANQTALSLDLINGQPRVAGEAWRNQSAETIAAAGIAVGIARIIVLDIARVGVSTGPGTIDLCRALRRKWPAVELIAGGGVRGEADLAELVAAGCDAALVSTSLHDGRITPQSRYFSGETK